LEERIEELEYYLGIENHAADVEYFQKNDIERLD